MKTSVIFFTELASKYFNIYLQKAIIYAAITTSKKCSICNLKYKNLNLSVRYLPYTGSFRFTLESNCECVSLYTKNNTLEIVYKENKKATITPFDWEAFETSGESLK